MEVGDMSNRQHKKLCKKAAEIIGFQDCEINMGVYHVFYKCRGVDFVEWNAEPAWDWLVGRFDGAVNTVVDDDSECGISWAPDHLQVKSTPANVFKWAKARSAGLGLH